jgi:hypothetical protein
LCRCDWRKDAAQSGVILEARELWAVEHQAIADLSKPVVIVLDFKEEQKMGGG